MTIAGVLASQRPASATAPGTVLTRGVLDRISRTKGGKSAAANTANRKRMCLNSAMEYAVEIGALVRESTPVGELPYGRRLQRFRLLQHRSVTVVRTVGPVTTLPLSSYRVAPICHAPAVGDPRLSRGSRPRAGAPWADLRPQPPAQRSPEGVRHRSRWPRLRRSARWNPHRPCLSQGLPRSTEEGVQRDRGQVPAHGRSLRAEARGGFHVALDSWRPCPGRRMGGHSVAVLLRVYTKCIHGMEQEALKRIWEATRG